ncbi:NAD(P)-dependent oxidoreductase [Streptomyces sp. NPDC050560]|uniref:NAD(P)-dependent oxidoreductase n=1 Tax=Streptomyces sp. NPDC050560 TaxID=3365630 RepID=UPI00379E9504
MSRISKPGQAGERQHPRVGVVGLGKMGRPIARHVAAGGFRVAGFDLDADAAEAARADGVPVPGTLEELLAECDLLLVAVDTEAAVRSVTQAACAAWKSGRNADGAAGDPGGGRTLVVLATITVTAMRELAALAAASGVAVLDGPLCKGEKAALDGELLVLVGGAPEDYAVCRGVFACFGKEVFHLGAVGAGQAAKLVNNLVLWASITATSEGFWLAEEFGVDLGLMREALLESSGRTWALETWYRPRDMPWAAKDMSMVLEEADRVGLSLPMAGVVHEAIKTVKRLGLPGSRAGSGPDSGPGSGTGGGAGSGAS